jgi:hypothetical protein
LCHEIGEHITEMDIFRSDVTTTGSCSEGTCRAVNTTIIVRHVIHRPVFYSKYDVSVAGFCLNLQVESNRLGPIEQVTVSGQSLSTASHNAG